MALGFLLKDLNQESKIDDDMTVYFKILHFFSHFKYSQTQCLSEITILPQMPILGFKHLLLRFLEFSWVYF